MWWIALNIGPITQILSASSVMPHYTVTFRFIFEFVILGVIPGTDIKIGFIDAMIFWLIILGIFLLSLSYKDDQSSIKIKTA